jgi:hypothetical protein
MKFRMMWQGLVMTAVLGWAGVALAQQTNSPTGHGTEVKLKALEEREAANPLPEGGILMLGSSTVEIWGKRHAFTAKEPIIWHGIGGTSFEYLLNNFDRLILNYKPVRVIVYSGDNDLGGGQGGERMADRVADNVRKLVAKLRERLPDAQIAVISIKHSIKRAAAEPLQRRVNDAIRALAEEDDHVDYLNLAPLLLGADGQPDPAHFAPDGLHIAKPGYEKWNKAVEDYLK